MKFLFIFSTVLLLAAVSEADVSRTRRNPASSQDSANEYITQVVANSRRRICSQDPEPGPCRAAIPRWHFNSTTRQCQTFIYGGCRGNENNFRDSASCMRYCTATAGSKPTKNRMTGVRSAGDESHSDIIEANRRRVCGLDAESGPCRALIMRWHYNPATEQCQQFVYGGCFGNENNFSDESSCLQFCTGSPIRVFDHSE